MRMFILTAALAITVLSACSEKEGSTAAVTPTAGSTCPTTSATGGGETSSSAMGPGLSVDEAIASSLDGPLLVNGHVVVADGEARLCDVLATSVPPFCAGASLTIEGLESGSVPDLKTEGDVTWTEQPVQLLGEVENGTITLTANAIG